MSIVTDWSYPRSAKAFTGLSSGSQGISLTCINNTPIPCSAREFQAMGKTRFTLTILDAIPGWAMAPHKRPINGKKTSKDPNAKPLFEVIRDAENKTQGVNLYSFKKAKSNFDRDERDDTVQSQLHIGQVISFFVQSFMYEARESSRNGQAVQNFIFPQEVELIQPFSILEVQVLTNQFPFVLALSNPFP